MLQYDWPNSTYVARRHKRSIFLYHDASFLWHSLEALPRGRFEYDFEGERGEIASKFCIEIELDRIGSSRRLNSLFKIDQKLEFNTQRWAPKYHVALGAVQYWTMRRQGFIGQNLAVEPK